MSDLITRLSLLIVLTLMMPLLSTVGTWFMLLDQPSYGILFWVLFGIDVYYLFKVRKTLMTVDLVRRDRS